MACETGLDVIKTGGVESTGSSSNAGHVATFLPLIELVALLGVILS